MIASKIMTPMHIYAYNEDNIVLFILCKLAEHCGNMDEIKPPK